MYESFFLGKIKDRFGAGCKSGVVKEYVQSNIAINQDGHFTCFKCFASIRSVRISSMSTVPRIGARRAKSASE